MALKSLIGGILAVLLAVLVVFNVIMPAITVVSLLLVGLVRGQAVAIPPGLVMPVAAVFLVLGVVYFFRKR